MIEILKAFPKDVEVIAPLFAQYRQFYKQPSNIEASTKFLNERLTHEESVIFYASDKNAVINTGILGFVQLYPSFSSISLKRLWILNDLFVIPLSRRGSVGSSLLQKAADFARETDARGLTLKTAVDNFAAQQLYESMGWKRDLRFYCYDFTNA